MEASAVPLGVVVLADDGSSCLEKIIGGPVPLLRKTYTNTGLAAWRSLFRRSRAEREFANLRALAAAGIPCVRPVSWSQASVAGRVLSSSLVLEYLPGIRNLQTCLSAREEVRCGRDYAAALGRLLLELHSAGFRSTTLSLRNVLVMRADDTLLLCDQPYAFLAGNAWLATCGKRVDLHDTFFAPRRCREWTRVERWRGLLAYCGGDRRIARKTWSGMVGRRVLPSKWRRQLCRLLACLLSDRYATDARTPR